jgi:hypothetical protein
MALGLEHEASLRTSWERRRPAAKPVLDIALKLGRPQGHATLIATIQTAANPWKQIAGCYAKALKADAEEPDDVLVLAAGWNWARQCVSERPAFGIRS